MRYGKELVILDERDISKSWYQCVHTQPILLWKRVIGYIHANAWRKAETA